MKKLVLSLFLSLGVYGIGNTCPLADEFLAWENFHFGFDSIDEMDEAHSQWVSVACDEEEEQEK